MGPRARAQRIQWFRDGYAARQAGQPRTTPKKGEERGWWQLGWDNLDQELRYGRETPVEQLLVDVGLTGLLVGEG